MAGDGNIGSNAQQQQQQRSRGTEPTSNGIAAQARRPSLNIWQRLLTCLHSLSTRRIRNESLFVMSLVQALCAAAMLILSAVLATRLAILFCLVYKLWHKLEWVCRPFQSVDIHKCPWTGKDRSSAVHRSLDSQELRKSNLWARFMSLKIKKLSLVKSQ